MYFTYPRGFSLTIACSRENEGYIRNILGKHAETTHFIIPFEANGEYETAHNEYNTLMQSPEFWEQIQADYILSMQTDCYLRKQLPDILWTVEYAAAPWAWSPVYVGGSGLTWRKKEAVLEMCRIVAKKPIAEDVFFSQRCLMLKKKVLPLEEGEHIFSESRFVDDPVGVHQWWTYLYQTDDESFIERYTKIYMTLDI
jgi:hypothetical protein